jgi:hypothetical protein
MLNTTYSPADIAKSRGCKTDKILALIKSGKLIAINWATSDKAKKPRWRITAEALEAFERSRSTMPASPPVVRRTRSLPTVKEYF